MNETAWVVIIIWVTSTVIFGLTSERIERKLDKIIELLGRERKT